MTDLGFMQGRLCDMVDGRIQAFPWRDWEAEFATAGRLGFGLMEWTLDLERLHENPLMTDAGRARIRALSAEHGVRVGSLTGDCFMQGPFYKDADRAARLAELRAVVEASAAVGISKVVFPLVDHGRLETREQEDDLVATLAPMAPWLDGLGVQLVFESDFPPTELARFIARLPGAFGVNYDSGNSASLGYDPTEELAAYGDRVLNVHVKDRVLGGTTVPLGTGNLDWPKVVAGLRAAGYAGPLILQTARAADGDHAGALCRHRTFVMEGLDGPRA